MTDKETIMYQILGAICEADAPIVFKGALITKLVLTENGYATLERHTRDIDANWVGAPPSMSELENTLNRSLESFDGKLRAEAFREYGDRKSAGFYIVENATGEKVVTMDIDIRPICGSRTYHYGEISIKGVLANEILADKITVLSGMKMFRRSKDLIDVYALTQCIEVQTSEIFKVVSSKQLKLGEFNELLTRRSDVEHAYNKLQGVEGKPLFDDVYPYLTKLVYPFAQKDKTPRIWRSEKQAWANISRVSEKPSILAQLCSAEQEARKHNAFLPSKSKHKHELER